MKESTAKNHLVVTWYACDECQTEFVLNPATAAYTPWGYDDLEWQTADLVELEGSSYQLTDADRSEAYQRYLSLESRRDEDTRG
ncbi:hypothetical protein PG996_005230 [Apiospora saccharicola]|uniref:Uncharacterized protein n=1 Tax=Apiospora saccharicola TaxID=335842 RepID=A0ABR1VKX1_9PEZI